MEAEINQIIFSTLKRLILNSLALGTLGALFAVTQASDPQEIAGFITPLFWIFLAAISLDLILALNKYKQRWVQFIKQEQAEAIGYLVATSIFAAVLTNGVFLLPLFSFPFLFHQLPPADMTKAILDYWAWREVGITILTFSVTALISLSLMQRTAHY